MENLDIITRALDGSALRSELISNNLANVSTPEYKRQDVDFKKTLKNEINKSTNKIGLAGTNSAHITTSKFNNSLGNFNSVNSNDGSYRNDGNNVDIDVEMAELAKNSIYYNVMSKRAASHFSLLNRVIQQGGKA
jgi:flagellar basal-body rod protein FlgB